jgi:hypothetical protein
LLIAKGISSKRVYLYSPLPTFSGPFSGPFLGPFSPKSVENVQKGCFVIAAKVDVPFRRFRH